MGGYYSDGNGGVMMGKREYGADDGMGNGKDLGDVTCLMVDLLFSLLSYSFCLVLLNLE